MQKLILWYFLFINIISFFIFALDKLKAKMGKRRVSEKTLHTLSFLGGFVGSSLSMSIFSHKISKKSFLTKHIFIVLIWIISIVVYFTKFDEMNFL